MSKKLSIVLIILLSILLACVVGGMIFLFNTDLDKFKFGFNFGIASGTSKKLVDEKEITNIKDIYVDSDIADVFIKTSETGTIKVELYSDDPETYEITELENKINVVLKEKSGSRGFNFKNSKINLYIPTNYANLINIENKTGDIEMDSFSSANFNAVLTTGDINIKEVNNATIKLTTGDVEIDSAYSVKSEATTGDFEAGTVRLLDVEVTTGDLNATELDKVKAKTTTGDIRFGIINDSLDLETNTGDVNVEKATVLNNSKIKTGTGDVNINQINDGIYVEGKSNVGDVKINKTDRKSDIELIINTRTGDIRVK